MLIAFTIKSCIRIGLFIILVLALFAGNRLCAQIVNEKAGTSFSKANRKSIDKKMQNLLLRVAEETKCPVDSISYIITEKYTTFYSKPGRHLPKAISFSCCGRTITYRHIGLSGAVLYWLLGCWTTSM
ncbi:MAG: hypothetical protein V4658_14110 [Bacteroidota bacterium]